MSADNLRHVREKFEAWARNFYAGITFYEFTRKDGGRGDYTWEPMSHTWAAYRAGAESQRGWCDICDKPAKDCEKVRGE